MSSTIAIAQINVRSIIQRIFQPPKINVLSPARLSLIEPKYAPSLVANADVIPFPPSLIDKNSLCVNIFDTSLSISRCFHVLASSQNHRS
jgi:hypothetical protein